jgi:hypothetical protein
VSAAHRRFDIGWPHLVTWGFMFVALVVGLYLNTQRINDTREGERERQTLAMDNCRAILTLSRNLFSPLPVDESTSPELVHYTQQLLAGLYYEQYRQLNKSFGLDERCGKGLPEGTPPPPPSLPTTTTVPPPAPPAPVVPSGGGSTPDPVPEQKPEPPGQAKKDTTTTTRPERPPLICLPIVGCIGQ